VGVGCGAFGIGDAIGGEAGGEDYLADAELTGGFEDVVGAEGVDAVGFVVGEAHGLGDT
jgi:hypothetical protein